MSRAGHNFTTCPVKAVGRGACRAALVVRVHPVLRESRTETTGLIWVDDKIIALAEFLLRCAEGAFGHAGLWHVAYAT